MTLSLRSVVIGVMDGLKEALSGHQVVLMVVTPEGDLHYGSTFETAEGLSNMVCNVGWQMASRVPPVVTPTHIGAPGVVQ